MKAVRIMRPGEMVYTEVSLPEPAPGFVRIRVKRTAICATDLEVIDGRIPAVYPLIPGHEWSGIVDAVGSEEDTGWIGKRVIGSNDVVCLKCDACRSGDWRYCSDFREIGFKMDGAYAEYMLAPAYGLCELPESLSFEEGALCEPLGVALGSMKKAGASLGDTCLIIGAGSIGLCMLAVAKAMGMSRITVAAASDKRMEIAAEMGAYRTVVTDREDLIETMKEIHPEGTDVVIEATGIEACISQSLKIAKKGGSVVLAGYGRGRNMTIRMDDIHINNLRVIGSGNNWNMHKKAVALMTEGLIDLKPLISEIIPLSDYERGIRDVRTRPQGFVKAFFRFD